MSGSLVRAIILGFVVSMKERAKSHLSLPSSPDPDPRIRALEDYLRQ